MTSEVACPAQVHVKIASPEERVGSELSLGRQINGLTISSEMQAGQSQNQGLPERLALVEQAQRQQQAELEAAKTALDRQGQQLAAHVQQCVEWERNHREQTSGRFVDMQVQLSGI